MLSNLNFKSALKKIILQLPFWLNVSADITGVLILHISKNWHLYKNIWLRAISHVTLIFINGTVLLFVFFSPSYFSLFLYSCTSFFSSTHFLFLNYSEDYYGDLDLKTIRKSELHSGLQKNGNSGNNNNTPPPPKGSSKPRPGTSPASQPRPQQSNINSQRNNQIAAKDAVYDDEAV